MKIKKLLLFLIISIFCFCPMVDAKEDIEVKKVKVIDSSEGVVSNAKDEIDLQFNDLEQTISYEVFFKNNTNKNLGVDNLVISGNSQEFLKFKLADNYDQIIISPNDEGSVIIKVGTEKVKLAGKNFDDTINLKFGFKEFIDNPYTSSNHISMIILVVLLSVSLAFIMTKFNNNKLKTVSVIACFMILGVSSVFANSKEYSTTFSGSVKYTSQNFMETTGTSISSYKVNYTNSKDVWAYYDKVKNIYVSSLAEKPKTYFKKFDLTNEDKNRVSAYLVENGDSNVPYDLHIVSRGIIYANENSSFLFSFPNVESINGLENIDFSNTTNMQGMFAGNSKLNNLDTKLLNMNKVTDTSYMFFDCYNLKVSKDDFDLSKVTTKNNMFVQYLSDVLKDNAQSDAKIDFSKVSSSTNGQGVYLRSGTEKDKNPIYYYRGNVTNNNVKFAGFCWKMVRTTETGGVKLIYNGTPNSSGYCSRTGSYAHIGTSAYNSSYDSPSYVGYMYGSAYTVNSKQASGITAGMVYGNDIEYRDGKYYLKDKYVSENGWSTDYSKIGEKYHYTCFSTESSCETINYIYYSGSANTAYYFNLTGGKTQLDILDEMLKNSSNENDSTIKTYIDDWYRDNMVNYTSYLEDTVWCNDRSISALNGWDKDKNATRYLYFGVYGRLVGGSKPSLECSGEKDKFTVSSSNGNGKLTYPVAMLTADEVVLAGASSETSNSNFYLYTGSSMFTLSPSYLNFDNAVIYRLDGDGILKSGTYVHSYLMSVRPSVSLKPGIDYVSGTGTTTNPYIIR